MPLEPKKENIHKIGKALAELFELRSDFYKLHPHLKPEKWDEPPSDEAFGEMYQKALLIVDEHLQASHPKNAIETLESYISIHPAEKT